MTARVAQIVGRGPGCLDRCVSRGATRKEARRDERGLPSVNEGNEALKQAMGAPHGRLSHIIKAGKCDTAV